MSGAPPSPILWSSRILRAITVAAGLYLLSLIVVGWKYTPDDPALTITPLQRLVSSFGYLAVALLILAPYRWTRKGWLFPTRMTATALVSIGVALSGVLRAVGPERDAVSIAKAMLLVVAGLSFLLAPAMDRAVAEFEAAPDPEDGEDDPDDPGFFGSKGFEPHVATKIKRFDRRDD